MKSKERVEATAREVGPIWHGEKVRVQPTWGGLVKMEVGRVSPREVGKPPVIVTLHPAVAADLARALADTVREQEAGQMTKTADLSWYGGPGPTPDLSLADPEAVRGAKQVAVSRARLLEVRGRG